MGWEKKIVYLLLCFFVFTRPLNAAKNSELEKCADALIPSLKSNEESLSAWKKQFSANKSKALQSIAEYDLPETARLAAARFAMERGLDFGLKNLPKFNLSNRSIFHIYKQLAEELPDGDGTIPRYIGDSGLGDTDKIEIFRIRWDMNEDEIDEHENYFDQYKFKDPDAFFRILKRYAEANPNLFIEEFDDDIAKLPLAKRLALGKILAADSDSDGMPWVSSLGLDRPIDRAKLLARSVTRIVNDWGWNDDYLNTYLFSDENSFNIDEDCSEKVAFYVIGHVRKEKLKQKDKFNQFLKAWCPQCVNGNKEKKLKEALYKRIPIQMMSQELGVSDYQDLPLTHPTGGRSLSGMVNEFARRHPDLLPENTSSILLDKVADRNVYTKLLEYLVSIRSREPSYTFTSSLQLLEKIMGFAPGVLTSSPLRGPPLTLYKLLIDLRDQFRDPILQGIRFSPEAFKQTDHLLSFIQYLRDYLYLSSNPEHDWQAIRERLPSKEVTVQALGDMSQSLKADIFTEVQNILGKSSAALSARDFDTLTDEWGELEPIFTLISRFNAKKEWRPEIKVIGDLMRASLADKFREFKFFGEDTDPRSREAAEKQLSSLATPAHQKAWMTTRTRLSLLPGNEKASDLEPAEVQLAKLSEQLPDRLGKVIPSERVYALVNNVLPTLHRTNPDSAIRQLLEACGDPRCSEEIFSILWTEVSEGTANKGGASKGLRVLARLHPEMFGEARDTVGETFKQLERVMNQAGNPSGSKRGTSILFTVLDSSPKFLITIGDLVQTSSCLNYRTGGMVGALLGYAIDANVQAVATFILKQDDFENYDDYRKVLQSLSNKEDIQVKWNGNRRWADFILPTGQSIRSRGLGDAYLRQIVKLGETKKSHKPGIRFEKEYYQDHPAMREMKEQHAAIRADLERAIGADPDEPVIMSETRNPGGIYSDLTDDRGTQRHEYVIP
jgi:hypothetical protein